MYYTFIFSEVKYNYPDFGINCSFIETDKYITTSGEKMAEQYNVRELQLIPIKEEEEAYEGGEIEFESVDKIVITQLETIESSTIDRQKLIDIYNEIEI